MTKKDYQLIAAALREAKQEAVIVSAFTSGSLNTAHMGVGFALDKLIVRLKQDNPEFKADLFLKAITG